MPAMPKQFEKIKKRYRRFHEAMSALGSALKESGPLGEKEAQLIQLAAAAAIRSEGSVHSHAKRALKAGAKPEEIRHAIILCTSTIGFPTVSAALSWADDVLPKK